MRENFLKVKNSYTRLISNPYVPSNYEEANYVERDLPETLIREAKLDKKQYMAVGSVGTGRWTLTSWVCIFDSRVTTSAKRGYYIAYLFRADMKGVYLSLMLGTTDLKKKYRRYNPRQKMKTIAENMRSTITYDDKLFPNMEIDLVAATENAKNYNAGFILGKYYDFDSMPENDILVSDLNEMVSIYFQLAADTRVRNLEETFDFYLRLDEIEETQFQKDVEVVIPANTPI